MGAANSYVLMYYDKYKHVQVTDGHLSLQDLPLVPITKGKKSYKEFFQIVRGVPLADQEAIRAAIRPDGSDLIQSALPNSVRPTDSLGESCRLQFVIQPLENGTCDILKFYHSSVDIPFGFVKVLCDDSALMIDYKLARNSNQVKVAFMHMLSQVNGQHWLRQGLEEKPQKLSALGKQSGDNKWNPDEDELRAGIQHINQFAPLSNSKNEQYLWVLLNVRDPESPLHGWPEHVVLKACTNRTTGNSQAEPEWFFPFLLNDLNEEFLEQVVPLVLPRMTSFGLMILGKAGIGKTPAAQIMSMAVARHLVHSRGLDGLPGYRKSKQIDGFRERPGEVQVPVLLDDPNLGSINLEDLKSFLDVGENCLVDARYRAAKFVRNQCRVVLSNEWDHTKEPVDAFLPHITWGQFKDMFITACQYPKMPHLMAILKRTVIIIAGHHAVYVRLPSEHETEPILRFNDGGITEDWLREKNKEVFGLFKQGLQQKYTGFEKSLEDEQALVARLLATAEEKKYIHQADCHERWRATARSSPQPPVSPTRANARSSPQPPVSPTVSFQIKEELISPEKKKPRHDFGVIDVEAEDIMPHANIASASEEQEATDGALAVDQFPDDEDHMNHGFGLAE